MPVTCDRLELRTRNSRPHFSGDGIVQIRGQLGAVFLLLWLQLAFAVNASAVSSAATGGTHPQPFGRDVLDPIGGQFDAQISGTFGFTGPGSIVRVREFAREGTGLHFHRLGMDTEQMPTIDLRYWFDRLDALHFRFRYFNIGGRAFFSGPVRFNGSTIAGGRTVPVNPSAWFSGGVYYERRLRPLLERYEGGWPAMLQKWDLRAMIGIEFTYLDFEIQSGHARVTPTSKGEETKEDFYHQSMPVPTIGLEALRRIDENFTFETSIQGNWINRWNSLRNEGGTVWTSQNGIEAHAKLYYSNRRLLGSLQPFVGFYVYTFSQQEISHEDGNFIRWSSYGPELGVSYSFEPFVSRR